MLCCSVSLSQASFGFGIGEAPNGDFVITEARPGTPADGRLAKGDVLRTVNGQATAGRSHSDIVGVISAGTEARFVVQRGASSPAQIDPSEMVEVVLTRDSVQASFGFGIGEAPNGDFVITEARPGTPADGRLAKGDVLRTVNGQATAGRSHSDIVGVISAGTEARFVVQRVATNAGQPGSNTSTYDSVPPAKEADPAGKMAEVVLTRDSVQASFGFGIGEAPNGDFVITEARPGTPADGRLAKGDVLRTVNGQATAGRSHSDIVGVISAGTEARFVVQRGGLESSAN